LAKSPAAPTYFDPCKVCWATLATRISANELPLNNSGFTEYVKSACSASPLTELLLLFPLTLDFSKLLQISLCLLKLFGSGAGAGEQLAISNGSEHQILLTNAIMRAFGSTIG
jgi:hypothetical protein